MPLLKTRLSLDDFMLEMMRFPPDRLQLEHLQSMVTDLDLQADFFRHHITFCDRHYQRRLVCRTPRFDLLILCWLPGQSSTIHDHEDSLNVTRVQQGVLTARTFATPADGIPGASTPHLEQEECLSSGRITTVDRHQIHQLANMSDQPLVTLHVYARPLHHIQVYGSQSGRAERLPVQYDVEQF